MAHRFAGNLYCALVWYQVRHNAAMALSTAAAKGAITGDDGGSDDQMNKVWQAMLQALEDSEPRMDFSEFKHAATLKSQVCSY